MYVHFFDRTLAPLTTVHRIISGNVTITANERGSAQIVVPASLPELGNVVLATGQRAFIYDNSGNLRLNGYVTAVHPGSDDITIEIVDLLEELRIIPMSPVMRLNGYAISLCASVLVRMPVIDGQRWTLGDTSQAINGWTSLDASRLSCMEAINALCEQTGNWFRTRERVIDIYAEPLQARPVRFLFQGQIIERTITALHTSQIVGDVVIETVSDQIYAGIFPEGSSYTDLADVSRTLRLNGTESVPAEYKLANVNGFWGVFSRELTGDPPLASLPQGLVRSEVFSYIVPLVNTTESIDIIVENVIGMALIASGVDGYAQNYWKDAKATIGNAETTVVASYQNSITLATMLPIVIGDNVNLSIERDWDAAKITSARQSLATVAVTYLHDRARAQVSIKVTSPSGADAIVNPGDRVRIRYSGGAIVRAHDIDRFLPRIRIDGEYAVAGIELQQQENIETDVLTISETLWRWPSASGLKEIMAVFQRRLSPTNA